MKRNKLYTANKWNQSAFMPHKFDLGSQMQRPFSSGIGNPIWDPYNNNDQGIFANWNSPLIRSTGNGISDVTSSYLGTIFPQRNIGYNPYNSDTPNTIIEDPTKDAFKLPSQKELKDMKLPDSTAPAKSNGFGNSAKAGIGALANTDFADKALDDLDPVHALAGGRESAVGNGLSTAGKGLFKAGASTGNGWLMLAGAKVLGGLTNAAFGVKYNKGNISDIENNITGMGNTANQLGNVTSNEGLMNVWSSANTGYDFSNKFIGKNGWFNHKATKKANNLRNQQAAAQRVLTHGLMEATKNVDAANDDRVMRTFAADGGILNLGNDNMGAIDYGFMSDYLNIKNRQANNKNNMLNTYLGNYHSFAEGGKIHIKKSKEGTFTAAATKHHMGVQEFADYVLSHKDSFSPEMRKKANFARNAAHWHSYGGLLNNNNTMFALGGDMQSNGADWSDGLNHVDAGGTHEENPNEGVPMGIAPDGQPNLVEEGETIWNDYVFSNRIQPDKDTLKAFHIGKNSKMTYADLSKKLEDEAKERPNDPISQAALKANMSKLADAQERQKQEEEAKKTIEVFESLSPEQQQALIAQAKKAAAQQQPTEQSSQEEQENTQEEQEPQDNSQYEDNGAEQPDDYQGEEQQAYEGNPQEQYAQEEQPTETAYGGNLHMFSDGGWKQKLSKAMKLYTVNQWNDWASKKGLKNFDWNSYNDLATLMKNEAFKSALAKDNAALADAMARNYDFGDYKYDTSKGKAITNIHNGNWKSANVGNGFQGWLDYGKEAPDPMVEQAIKNYI